MTNHELEARPRATVEREGTRPGLVFKPDVDIVEDAAGFLLTADLPGADDSTVRVHLEDGVLTLDARSAETLPQDWRPLHREYRSGGYHREFRLGEGIDGGRIQASMKDGVLDLRLPKAEHTRPRSIPITRG